MENLYVGLFLSAVTGITFIAYKHPEFYKKEFSDKIIYGSLIVLVGSMIHDTGVASAHQELLTLLKEGVSEEILIAIKKAEVRDEIYFLSIATFLFGGFLSWLAEHMKNQDIGKEEDQQE